MMRRILSRLSNCRPPFRTTASPLGCSAIAWTARWPQPASRHWGNSAGCIRLNTDLARKPSECLEYIIVHEMVHLIEPTHNDRFIALMDKFMPKWQFYRELLNRLPVRHEYWDIEVRILAQPVLWNGDNCQYFIIGQRERLFPNLIPINITKLEPRAGAVLARE
jgi:Protein of unknown function DUF45